MEIKNKEDSVANLIQKLFEKTRSSKSLGERYSLFPIKDEMMYGAYKKQEMALWTSNEMDFSRDRHDYLSLKPDLKKIIDYVNAFFSATDGIIIDNIILRFLLEANTIEEQAFFITQAYDELVHSETYSLIINSLVIDETERLKLLMSANNLDCVRNKDLWLEKFILSDLPVGYRRLAFAAGEGIFFTSSFLFIFYFRSKGILQNIIFVNEQISKDEGLHRDVGVKLYMRDGKLTDDEAFKLIREAVELECKFVSELIPNPIDDINKEDIHKYVKFLGDHLLASCSHPKLYDINVSDLPTWIGEIALQQKNNFYEVRVGSYKQASLAKALDWRGRIKGNTDELNSVYSNPSDFL